MTRTLSVCALLICGTVAVSQEPTWYPETEPSPFMPDDALWVGHPAVEGQGWAKTLYLRAEWSIDRPVQRAVLMTAPMQTARVYLDGGIVLTGHDVRECLPVWADVTERLEPGTHFIAAKVYSEWRPVCYVQMRVEYEDGEVADFITDGRWQVTAGPADDWHTNPDAEGLWRAVDPGGGYHREPGDGIWGREFALLPREALRESFERHNEALERLWETDATEPGLRIVDAPEKPEWAEQFDGFARVDEATGQLIDGAGQIRHLFFTIYNQRIDGNVAMSVHAIDVDQLERDLDLMADAGVHLYMRQTGWDWLLTKDGEWAALEEQPRGTDLPEFVRGIDLLEYFVRRAHAHGRYIVFEGDFYWGAHRDVVSAPYRSRYYLYPEVARSQALAMRRIMNRFRECPNVLGMMIGEEDILLANDLENPHQHALFAEFLERKHGDLQAFKAATPRGYDYGDLSSYAPQTRGPEFWPGASEETVLRPAYKVVDAPYAQVGNFLGIPMPHWPSFRSVEDPSVPVAGYKSYNEFTPEDPLWIDFYEMREGELLFGMLHRWATTMRDAMPNQLLFYSNAQDFTNSWHFLHLFRRAELPFDVIGVGCHDSEKALADLPAWATVRKAIKVISSYRPYALAEGSPAKGIASGEGEGGAADDPQDVLNYYRGALFDEIGGGAAWTQTYTWLYVSGAMHGGEPHETPLLKWFGEFMPAAQGVPFPLRRPVEVLVVRNTDLQHSHMSGHDYGNVRGLAEALTQLNVEFDIVMDRDLSYGPEEHKIDLSPYRLIVLASVTMDHPAATWEALEAWLTDEGSSGERVIAVGRVGQHGRRFSELEGFPEALRRWLGQDDYAENVNLRGAQDLALGAGEEMLHVDFGNALPTGVLEGGEAFLTSADGVAVGLMTEYGGNRVLAYGFPLGLATNELWGLEPQQEPRDAMAPLLEHMMMAAGVERPVIAPYNLRVYLAEAGEMLLVRERAGLGGEYEIAVRVPEGVEYEGLELTRNGDGYARATVRLEAWEGKHWKAK